MSFASQTSTPQGRVKWKIACMHLQAQITVCIPDPWQHCPSCAAQHLQVKRERCITLACHSSDVAWTRVDYTTRNLAEMEADLLYGDTVHSLSVIFEGNMCEIWNISHSKEWFWSKTLVLVKHLVESKDECMTFQLLKMAITALEHGETSYMPCYINIIAVQLSCIQTCERGRWGLEIRSVTRKTSEGQSQYVSLGERRTLVL